MSKLLSLITLSILIPSIFSTYSCVAGEKSIQLGQSIVVCIHLVYKYDTGDIINTYAFNTTVDKFGSLKINNLKDKIKNSSFPVYAVAQVQNTDSSNATSMLLFSKTLTADGSYRELFSFVVNINQGIVTGITDDTADCGNCDTTQSCTEATGYKCYSKGLTYGGNDPRFFISWIGTDNSGNYMLSHTKRLSRFTQYSIGSIYNTIVHKLTG